MPSRSRTSRRLFVAFASFIALFGVAASFALSGMREIDRGLEQLRAEEERLRLALELASAVRDQYAHQAHTIIIGDASHLGFYGEAQARVLALARGLKQRANDPEVQRWTEEIARASDALDFTFRERVVPAVLAREVLKTQEEHGELLLSVSLIQLQVDRLAARFEESMKTFERQVHDVERSAYVWTAGALLVAILLGASIAWAIGRSIAVPVEQLSAGAARLAQGDLRARIAIASRDEFGDLAERFNAMAAALADHQARLIQSEKMAGIGRLAAGVAHEINNPLGVILGYARLLEKKAGAAEAADLRVIVEETHRCKDIVEGLLDLSRPLPPATEEVDLRELCDETRERLERAGLLAAGQLRIEGAASAPGNGPKLRQVVFNLLRNAAEASPASAPVEIRLEERPGAALLAISDRGPGLTEAARARLFEPFFTTKPHGTGLGLAVSQAIVRAHGGALEAGPAPAGGARFLVRLPRATEGA